MTDIKEFIEEYSANLQMIEDRKEVLKAIESAASEALGIDKADFKKVATAAHKAQLSELIEVCVSIKELAETAV